MPVIALRVVALFILILLLCYEIQHYVAMNTKPIKGLCLRQVDASNNNNKKKTANIVEIFLTYLFFLRKYIVVGFMFTSIDYIPIIQVQLFSNLGEPKG